jgi:hypothetical protein
VIEDGTVQTVFQPIVHLESGTVAAFEALTRGQPTIDNRLEAAHSGADDPTPSSDDTTTTCAA